MKGLRRRAQEDHPHHRRFWRRAEGRLTAEALAKVGHTVYASMRDVVGKRNAQNAAEMALRCRLRDSVDLRAVELDVQSGALDQRGRRKNRRRKRAGIDVVGTTQAI